MELYEKHLNHPNLQRLIGVNKGFTINILNYLIYKETNNYETSPNLYQIFNALNYQQTHCEQSVKDDIKGARVRLESLVSGKCGARIDLIKKECLALTR